MSLFFNILFFCFYLINKYLRQQIILSPTYFHFIDLSIETVGEMQEVLKDSTGSIYKLSELIGGFANLQKLWFKHSNAIRSKACMFNLRVKLLS